MDIYQYLLYGFKYDDSVTKSVIFGSFSGGGVNAVYTVHLLSGQDTECDQNVM